MTDISPFSGKKKLYTSYLYRTINNDKYTASKLYVHSYIVS